MQGCDALKFVMAGLRPGHPRLSCFSAAKTWMPGTGPDMTNWFRDGRDKPGHDEKS
jgi:hypothetical protein